MGDIKHTLLNGIPVVRLIHGPYEADICPSAGANCIRFARHGLNAMRTPPNGEVFSANPNVYGTPLLFPPNRIANGTYTFRDKTYHLPINEPARGHFIHGTLSSTPFSMITASANETGTAAAFTVAFRNALRYPFFPYSFSATMEYRLDTSGLAQALTLSNDSAEEMPVGLGFHTAFALPFIPETLQDDYRLHANVGRELCLNSKTIIPTGEYRSDSPVGTRVNAGSLCPAHTALSNHFQGLAGEITLSHVPSGAAIHYTPDPGFSFLMLWNGGGNSGFVCPEPQSWQVDAPNASLPPEITGFRTLMPGKSSQYTNHFSVTTGSLPVPD